ncbi:hypothetical protein FA95DRAFT_1666756 [Auriscalpium vulgare]|uniref:Uncharacterized protein n=1 Tax=Auriscalpium vulgare TaxID=40419 RepID=A0ACB8R2G5_9AGAM|nr:hypothetical protein FA95DRAFT_1666756 [Auriscalpium vulgare]
MLSAPRSSRQPVREAWSMQRLVRERAIALGFAIDQSTAVTYSSHLQSYLTFCKLHNFPIEPTVDTLSFYITFMSNHIKPRSVKSYLSGICNQLEADYPSVRDVRRHPLVTKTLSGCLKRYNTPTTRKDPLTLDHLQRLVTSHANPSHNSLLFLAVVFVGFFGLHRLGELTDADRVNLRDPRKTIGRASVRLSPESFSYFLPGHKGDRFFEGNTVVIARRRWPDDRIQALGRWTSDTFRIYIRKNPVLLQALTHPPPPAPLPHPARRTP